MQFKAVFAINDDGSITPHFTVRVAGVVIQSGAIIHPGYIVGGIDLTQYKENELEVEIENNIYVIKGIY